MTSIHQGQTRRAPYVLPSLGSGESIASLQANFALSEADFLRLQSPQSKTSALVGWVFGGWVGYVIGLLPKIKIVSSMPDYSGISEGEKITAGVILIIGLLLWLAGIFLPNDKRTATKKIKKYFADYQASQQH